MLAFRDIPHRLRPSCADDNGENSGGTPAFLLWNACILSARQGVLEERNWIHVGDHGRIQGDMEEWLHNERCVDYANGTS